MRAHLSVPVILVSLSVALTSCVFGPNPSRSAVARSPYGAMVAFHFLESAAQSDADSRLDLPVELLLINDAGLLVNAGQYLVLVRFGSFRVAELRDAPGVGTIWGNNPDPENLDRARLYARYPYGLSEEQLATLLAERNQPSVIMK